jgi:uridine phosphorylase
MPKYSPTDLIVNNDGSIYHLNLKPEHIADRIITVGDPSRVHRVSAFFDKVEFEMNKREFITHTGTYKGKRITVISTGMGTDNVEILMTELDAIANIDLKKREPRDKPVKLQLVRIGTSGTIQEDVPVDSHILSEYGIGLDSLMHFYKFQQKGFELKVATEFQKALDLPYMPYCVRGSDKLLKKFDGIPLGNTLTCHGFYAPQGREIRTPIRYPNLTNTLMYFNVDDFWITNIEMETAGYYAMSRLLGHQMVSTNAILANRVKGQFSKNPNKTIDELIEKVLGVI